MHKILKKSVLNKTVTRIVVDAPLVAKKAEPGQFVVLRIDEYGERFPLSIAGADRKSGSIDLIFEAVGRSTMLLNQMKEGDFISDIAGPLGKPVMLENLKKVCAIGGGTGNALMYPLVTKMHAEKIEVEMISGYKAKKHVILEKGLPEKTKQCHIMTEDGSLGEKGSVLDKFKQLLEAGNQYDEIIVAGPTLMMKEVANLAAKHEMKSKVFLTAYMVDGNGMCGGCRCRVGGETRFVCVDGPVFDGALVDWDDLMMRNEYYKKQEDKERAHVCRITGGVRTYD